ncbi:Rv3654c family TadE-like protein [Alloscardovia omnicolens]|uniref:Rv3654c family TadE-like protein n=1 Tax=Alloscardovia omnicolens TaxID=419015 RepID=UPI003A68FAAB
MRGKNKGIIRSKKCAAWWARNDDGSGTLLGVALIALVSVLACLAVCAGSYLVCQSQALSFAHQVALDAAFEHQLNTLEVSSAMSSPCNHAQSAISHERFSLQSCTVEGHDVQVEVQGVPSIEFLPHPVAIARAGPAQCVPRNR